MSPLLIMAILFRGSKLPQWLLSILTGLGAGFLLGHLTVHVLPDIFAAGRAGPMQIIDSVSLLLGMAMFMIIDKVFRWMSGGDGHHHDHHGHDESSADHSHHSGDEASSTAVKSSSDSGLRSRKAADHGHVQDKHDHGHHHQESSNAPAVRSFGFLNLLGSVSHSLSDGLALGFAHFTSPAMALSVTFAILMHEIPHKIGDFALLLQAGVSRGRALWLSFLTSIGTWAGILLAMSILSKSGDSDAEATIMTWDRQLMPFTAGAVLYTATVGILGDILDHSDMTQFIIQVPAMALGVVMMIMMMAFE
jgi:zinc transporter 7